MLVTQYVKAYAGRTLEETMRYVGYGSGPGMQATERAIVDIFRQKSGER